MVRWSGVVEWNSTMSPEYDLSKARRSRYPRLMRQGHTVTIRHADGTVTRTLYLPPLVSGQVAVLCCAAAGLNACLIMPTWKIAPLSAA